MEIISLRDLDIAFSYDTGRDDPVHEFYIPVLSEALHYDRIAGFFTSASLAVAARGIAGLINNKGKMRLISSPRLSKEDMKVLECEDGSLDDFINQRLLADIEYVEDEFQKDHLKALGWMLSKKYLEIKIALVGSDIRGIDYKSIFHQKIGIMTDKYGNSVSFSGSINETAGGWLRNVEEFKVFRSWEIGQDSYLDEDIDRFDKLWRGHWPNVITMPVPLAITEKLIEVGKDFSEDHITAMNYVRMKRKKSVEDKLNLFSYQKEAVEKWKSNSHQLLFEMATGTGKTRTAIACISYFINTNCKGLVVISSPQSILSLQWKDEIEKIGVSVDNFIIADGNRKWREELKKEAQLITLGFHNHAFVYTTHSTSSSNDFIQILKENASKIAVCFVGDEAHALGAYKTRRALLDDFSYRIGLSATPARWFDDYGTQLLQNYFGNDTFCFTINQAQKTVNPHTNKAFLAAYEYHPIFVNLNENELEKYSRLSEKIKKMATYSESDDEYQRIFEQLCYSRANIQKNALQKLDALKAILKNKPTQNTLIFTSDVQINKTMQILRDQRIIAHRFTQEQGTVPEQRFNGLSERQHLVKKFREGYYQALVAIKCLDEGIDIPSADTAILMSNSTNPREYIQRIGRVIRQASGKEKAYIYDFVVVPNLTNINNPEVVEFEKQIFMKELIRVQDMSANSLLNADVLVKINDILRRL